MGPHLIAEGAGQLGVQALFQLVLVVVGQPGGDEGRRRVLQLVDVQAQRLGVAGHDGAVEMVARRLVLLALPLAAGHPDEVHGVVAFLGQQVHDMAVGELRRIAHALGWHALDARLVGLLRRRIGQHHAIPQLREEGEPERVVLVHVERARDAHGAACIFCGDGLVGVEQPPGLPLEEVRHVGLRARAHALALLAAVAGDEASVLAGGLVDAGVVHGQQAAVGAALAAHRAMAGGQGLDGLERKERARIAFRVPIACQ